MSNENVKEMNKNGEFFYAIANIFDEPSCARERLGQAWSERTFERQSGILRKRIA